MIVWEQLKWRGFIYDLKMKYELVYIITPKIGEEETQKKREEILAMVEKTGAKVIKDDFWGEKEMAYPVKKCTTGFYGLVEFEGEGDQAAKVEAKMKMLEDILRYLVVKKDEVVAAARAEEAAEAVKAEEEKERMKEEVTAEKEVPEEPKEEKKEEVEEKAAEEKPVKKKKISLDEEADLDKKIDEILGKEVID